jgi:hypothetical protein
MASKISGIIPSQQYEIIRDKIGLILYEEIGNQYVLTSNKNINAKVFVERFVPFDKTDFPCLNVIFNGGQYSNKNVTTAEGGYIFYVDVYASAKTTTIVSGDSEASFRLHKLLGISRAILENPQYRNLGFTDGKIGSVSVSDISINQPSNSQDGTSSIMGRLTFNVKALEDVELLDASVINSTKTEVKLNLTDKGYLYENI